METYKIGNVKVATGRWNRTLLTKADVLQAAHFEDHMRGRSGKEVGGCPWYGPWHMENNWTEVPGKWVILEPENAIVVAVVDEDKSACEAELIAQAPKMAELLARYLEGEDISFDVRKVLWTILNPAWDDATG